MHYDIADQEMLKQEGITIVSLNRHFNRLRNKTWQGSIFMIINTYFRIELRLSDMIVIPSCLSIS